MKRDIVFTTAAMPICDPFERLLLYDDEASCKQAVRPIQQDYQIGFSGLADIESQHYR